MQTYLKLKCNFGFKNYLHILSDFNQRKSFTKFRISNHKLKIETGRYSKPITPLENRIICLDEIESEEHLLLKCFFYYTSRHQLLETIKNNINHSNFEKLTFGDKFIWLLNSESKDTLICMCDFLLKSHCFGWLLSHILTLVMSLILVFIIYMIFYAITLCFIMFIWPFVGPFIWTNKILSYLIAIFNSLCGFSWLLVKPKEPEFPVCPTLI